MNKQRIFSTTNPHESALLSIKSTPFRFSSFFESINLSETWNIGQQNKPLMNAIQIISLPHLHHQLTNDCCPIVGNVKTLRNFWISWNGARPGVNIMDHRIGTCSQLFVLFYSRSTIPRITIDQFLCDKRKIGAQWFWPVCYTVQQPLNFATLCGQQPRTECVISIVWVLFRWQVFLMEFAWTYCTRSFEYFEWHMWWK